MGKMIENVAGEMNLSRLEFYYFGDMLPEEVDTTNNYVLNHPIQNDI